MACLLSLAFYISFVMKEACEAAGDSLFYNQYSEIYSFIFKGHASQFSGVELPPWFQASGVPDALANTLLSLKPPLWYLQAEKCCNHELSLRDEDEHPYDSQLYKHCLQYTYKSPYATCEPDLCYAVKKGFATTDGAINKEILQLLMEVELDNNRETLDKILAHCVYGNLSKYPRGLCQLKKVNMCIAVYIQDEILKGCHDWKEHLFCFKMRLEVTRNIKKYL